MQVRNVYVFIKKDSLDKCIKYGMKLSEHSDITYIKNNVHKKGILGYISPKDSDKYNNKFYKVLRIKTNNINIYVHNSSLVDNNLVYNYKNMVNIEEYMLGDFINPEIIISSSILPENIFLYNKIIDVPLLVDNSKEFYLSKSSEEEVDDITFDVLKSGNLTN